MKRLTYFYPLRVVAATLLMLGLTMPLRPDMAHASGSPHTTGVTHAKGSGPLLPASCTIAFTDVLTSDYFYEGVFNLFCRGAISGYPDSTFRPGNHTTRGQLSKIEVLAMGWPLLDPSVPTFSDVPGDNTFFQYIETAYAHLIIGGYNDGTFRPDSEVTRSQLAKIVVSAEGWSLLNPPAPTFNDVAPGSAFYSYVETAVAHGVLSGYPDGSFRPGSVATRGQISKIIFIATSPPMTAEEAETIRLINERRATIGLGTLRVDLTLNAAARRHSYDIGPPALCQHDGTDGSSPWDRIADAGYRGWGAGEVVGCSYSTPLSIVDGWWASPGHYAILTDPNVNDIGCGWWINTQGFGWQTCDTGVSTP